MKRFFKKYIGFIIYFVLCVALIALTPVWIGFMIIGAFAFGGALIFFAIKSKRKYNDAKDYSNDDDYFDGTKYDYDEDIYYIGTSKGLKKQIGKNFFSKFNALMPTIIFSLVGIGFIIMGLTGVFKVLLGL